MIPTYNCTPYLAEAINSVLMQDMGEENMQIEVVDDASTDADVAQLVATLGKGRIRYFRQVANVGSLRNFETCLNRSQGQWVHLLHGDDRVAPGFYTEIATLFHQYPEAGAAFTNTANLQMHATGVEIKDRPPIVPKAGLLPDLLLRLAEGQQLETPSMVVKRSVYEQLGGFFAVHYGEDWIMWARIAAHFPVAYSPKCLAHYRYLNNTSITHRFIREGQNVRDITKVLTIINQYLPVEHRKRLKAIGLRNYAYYCLSLSEGLSATDKRAAIKQLRGALKMSQHSGIILWSLKIYLKTLLDFKRLKLDPANSQ